MHCTNCGNEYDAWQEQARCPFCGAFAAPGQADPPPPGAEGPVRGDCAWERRRSWLDLPALLEMVRAVLIEPGDTFRRMRLTGLGPPLLFALLTGTLVAVAGLFWNLAFQSLGVWQSRFALEEYTLSTGLLVAAAVASPLLVILATFVSAGILHLCLMLTGGARNGFEATFRVYAYVYGATVLFQLLPCCGGLIYLVWSIVGQTIGLVEMHRTTTGRALLAVLLPLILCFSCLFLALGLGIGAALMASGSGLGRW